MMRRYGFSKLANVLFASELQRRFDADGVSIISISLDPGPVGTEGALSIFPGFLGPLLKRFVMANPSHGAWPSLFAAADRSPSKGGGNAIPAFPSTRWQ